MLILLLAIKGIYRVTNFNWYVYTRKICFYMQKDLKE